MPAPVRADVRNLLVAYPIAVACGALAGALLLGLLTMFAGVASAPEPVSPASLAILLGYGLTVAAGFGMAGAPLAYAMIRWIPEEHRSSPAAHAVLGQGIALLVGFWLVYLASPASVLIWLMTILSLCVGGAVSGLVFWRLAVRPAAA